MACSRAEIAYLATASFPGFGRRRLRARVSGLLASSLDFLQGTFEKIHLQRLVHQHPFELMQFSAKRGLRRTAGDRLCTLDKRRELIPPFVEQSPMDAELLRQRHDVVARLQSLDGHSAEFFRPPTPSLFSHWQCLSLPVCLNELSQIWGSVQLLRPMCACEQHLASPIEAPRSARRANRE